MSTHLIDEAAELIEEVPSRLRRIVLQADVEDARRTASWRGFEADVLALAAGRELFRRGARRHRHGDDPRRAELRRTAARRGGVVSIEPTTLAEFVAAIGQHGESDQPAPHLAPHPAPLPASQSAPESRSIQ
jgi:hypothetical protein